MSFWHRQKGPLVAFLAVFCVALSFAWATNHVWEDYYITARSSRNLATGHGLVFNHGDRLHTFTSPLGVLLPALSYRLSGDGGDAGALWIFRVMSGAALGGAAALLVAVARRRRDLGLVAMWMAVALGTDAKSVDFTINGMETAFMLLFLAQTFWAQLRPGRWQWLQLGAAWAGLMWTRPDSFIYVSLISAGFWLFNQEAVTGATRRGMLALFAKAGGVAAGLYLPWLAWATWYYGSPVPHTIVAKGAQTHPFSLSGFLATAVELPWLAWTRFASLELTFLPSYFMIGGWPSQLVIASRVLATLCAFLWVVPRLRVEVRSASFAFFGAHIYLTYFPPFPFPWYVPSTTMLAIIALGGLLAAGLARARTVVVRGVLLSIAVAALAGNGWITWQVGRQVAAQQRIIEDGNRRRIGEWLKAHAQPGDAVFMEPLGYIGFFSGLKTYDYPGMSSREMVKARKEFGEDWARLIFELAPRWVVLRPFEIDRVNRSIPGILSDHYRIAAEFDRSGDVARLEVRGRDYLAHDAHFSVFELVRPFAFVTDVVETVVPFPVTWQMLDGENMGLMHAPSRMVVRVPALAKRVTGGFCLMPGAIAGPGPTDGAEFQIELRSGGKSTRLLNRILDPLARVADRPVQKYAIDLPRDRAEDAVLVFQISPGPTANQDWTCWSVPDFR